MTVNMNALQPSLASAYSDSAAWLYNVAVYAFRKSLQRLSAPPYIAILKRHSPMLFISHTLVDLSKILQPWCILLRIQSMFLFAVRYMQQIEVIAQTIVHPSSIIMLQNRYPKPRRSHGLLRISSDLMPSKSVMKDAFKLIRLKMLAHCMPATEIARKVSKNVCSLKRSLNRLRLHRVTIVAIVCQMTTSPLNISRVIGPFGRPKKGMKNGNISILLPVRRPAADSSKSIVIVLKIPLWTSNKFI